MPEAPPVPPAQGGHGDREMDLAMGGKRMDRRTERQLKAAGIWGMPDE